MARVLQWNLWLIATQASALFLLRNCGLVWSWTEYYMQLHWCGIGSHIVGIYLLVGITRSKVFFHSGKHDVQSELGATYCRCHSHSSAGKKKHAPNGDMTCWTSSLEKDAFDQQQAIFTCLHARKRTVTSQIH
jgi:hypothetical protein